MLDSAKSSFPQLQEADTEPNNFPGMTTSHEDPGSSKPPQSNLSSDARKSKEGEAEKAIQRTKVASEDSAKVVKTECPPAQDPEDKALAGSTSSSEPKCNNTGSKAVKKPDVKEERSKDSEDNLSETGVGSSPASGYNNPARPTVETDPVHVDLSLGIPDNVADGQQDSETAGEGLGEQGEPKRVSVGAHDSGNRVVRDEGVAEKKDDNDAEAVMITEEITKHKNTILENAVEAKMARTEMENDQYGAEDPAVEGQSMSAQSCGEMSDNNSMEGKGNKTVNKISDAVQDDDFETGKKKSGCNEDRSESITPSVHLEAGDRKVEASSGEEIEKSEAERLNSEARAAVLNSSSSDRDSNVSASLGHTEMVPEQNVSKGDGDSSGDEHLARLNMEAKMSVLQSTSSEAEPISKLLQVDEVAPRKRLKTKRELDRMRRKSGFSDEQSDTSQDEENRGVKRKATDSPNADGCEVSKKPKHDNIIIPETLDPEALSSWRVNVPKLHSIVKLELSEKNKVMFLRNSRSKDLASPSMLPLISRYLGIIHLKNFCLRLTWLSTRTSLD